MSNNDICQSHCSVLLILLQLINMKVPLPSNLRIAKQVASHPAAKSFATKVHKKMPAGTPSESAKAQADASAGGPSFESIGIKNTDIVQKSGVSLDSHQKVLVGSVLDVRHSSLRNAAPVHPGHGCAMKKQKELTSVPQLFTGNPTLKHLSLWSREATFQDPITKAEGYDQFAPQWYGLPALFHPIVLKSHTVVSAGNPIEIKLSNSYTVKGIKSEQTMDSVVRIDVGPDGKITRVDDRWNDNMPEGAVAQVCLLSFVDACARPFKNIH